MNILVVLGHPHKDSLNHAIAQTALQSLLANGHQVVFHDLYAEQFDPITDYEEIPKGASLNSIIQQHCDELIAADGIVIIHPNWWGQPPAILKGWIDRVIRPGIAYEFREGDSGEGIPVGLLKAHTAIVLNTSNTPRTRELEVFGDPLELIWKNCIFDLCGVPAFHRHMFEVVVTSTVEQRTQWLAEVQTLINGHFPVDP